MTPWWWFSCRSLTFNKIKERKGSCELTLRKTYCDNCAIIHCFRVCVCAHQSFQQPYQWPIRGPTHRGFEQLSSTGRALVSQYLMFTSTKNSHCKREHGHFFSMNKKVRLQPGREKEDWWAADKNLHLHKTIMVVFSNKIIMFYHSHSL